MKIQNLFVLSSLFLITSTHADVGVSKSECSGALILTAHHGRTSTAFKVSAYIPKLPTSYTATGKEPLQGTVEFYIRNDYFAPHTGGNGIGLNAGKGSMKYAYDLSTASFAMSDMNFNFDAISENSAKSYTIADFSVTKVEYLGLGIHAAGIAKSAWFKDSTFILTLACSTRD